MGSMRLPMSSKGVV